MSRTEPKGWHGRGYLPHFNSPEAVQHIVFRIAGSVPAHVIAGAPDEARARRAAVERLLDSAKSGRALADAQSARIVIDALRHFDGERYRLLAWCVMPSHVHVVAEQAAGVRLGDVVKSWKSFSARRINALRGASGPFWAPDYFDRYVRDERHFAETVNYVENNPVAAGLVRNAEDWPYSSAFTGKRVDIRGETPLDNEPPGSQ